MDLGLKDKVIVVSGGARGIGNGIVMALSREGAIPVIIGHHESDNIKAVEAVTAIGGQAFQFTAELSIPEECESSIKKIIAKFGRIDGLVNNAGVNDSVGLEDGDYKRFMESLHKNMVHYY
jgi:L-fucose dehydrogenase